MWGVAAAATRRRLLQEAASAAAAAEGNGTAAGAAAAAGGDSGRGGGGGGGGRGSNSTDAVRNVIDDDFTDMETVVLTCITTLVTLVFALIAGFCVRFLWRKLRERSAAPGYEGVLQREESSDPLAVKSLSASGNLLTDEVRLEAGGATKTTTTKFSASASPHQNGVFVVEVQQGGVPASAAAGAGAAAAAAGGAGGTQPYAPSSTLFGSGAAAAGATASGADAQRAQVHRPPEIEIDDADDIADIDDVDDEEEDEARGAGAGAGGGAGRRFGSTNTGLSQSDLSMSSAGSNNPSYRYGNQVGYESGHFGYPQYSGYSVGEDGGAAEADVVVVEAVHAQLGHAPGIGGHRVDSVDHTLAYGPLMSDSQALKRCQDAQAEAEEDLHQEEQRQLGNGTGASAAAAAAASTTDAATGLQRKGSLPPRLAASSSSTSSAAAPGEDAAALDEERLSTVAELPISTPAPTPALTEDASLRGKRASLPIITPDLYKQTKSLLLDKGTRAPVAPKFERLRDEASPLDDGGGGGAATAATPSTAGGGGGGGGSQYENRAFVSAEQATS